MNADGSQQRNLTRTRDRAFVGSRKLSITADVYTHVLVDGREIDLLELLAESRG